MQQLIKYLFYSRPKLTVLHALLELADKRTAIVCFSDIVEGSISNEKCRVKWHDGKEYDGNVAFTGKDSRAQQDNFPSILFGWAESFSLHMHG